MTLKSNITAVNFAEKVITVELKTVFIRWGVVFFSFDLFDIK